MHALLEPPGQEFFLHDLDRKRTDGHAEVVAQIVLDRLLRSRAFGGDAGYPKLPVCPVRRKPNRCSCFWPLRKESLLLRLSVLRVLISKRLATPHQKPERSET